MASMTPEQLTRERERLARLSQGYMDREVLKLQSQLTVYLRNWLNANMKVDDTTNITYSVHNQRLLSRIPDLVSKWMGSNAGGLVKYIVNKIEDLFGLNVEYFASIGQKLPRAERVLRMVMLQYGYDVGAKKLIPGGWLEQLFQSQPVAQGVATSMQNAISANSTRAAFQANLTAQLTGGAQMGWLQQHFTRFARDLFIQVDRETQNQAADDLGLNFAVYSGTLKDNSRCFCRQRVGQVFTREEIMSWNRETWKGKIRNTDVLIQGGGFNCRHSLSWLNAPLAARYIESRGLNQFNNVLCNPRTS